MLPILRKLECNFSPLNYRAPWNNLNRILDEFWTDQALGVQNFGNLDLHEDDERVYIDVELPGCKNEDIELNLEDQILHLKARRNEDNQSKENNYYVRERIMGNWTRSVQLPVAVHEENVQASFKDGILKISLEKQPKCKNHKIPVK